MCGGIFFRFRRRNDEDTELFEDFWSLNYFIELFKVQSSPNPLIMT
jgi:hypothetical protein